MCSLLQPTGNTTHRMRNSEYGTEYPLSNFKI